MSKVIENPKKYAGAELASTFFRPMLSGSSAIDLGVRVMYNMPVPTTLNFWRRTPDTLKAYAKGWTGGVETSRYQKTINLSRVKAEMSYAASDYFSMVYELIVGRSEVNLADLSGTELEAAETELFKKAIAESIRATMWLGNTTRATGFNTFDGFIKQIAADSSITPSGEQIQKVAMTNMTTVGNAEKLFQSIYEKRNPELRSMKGEGQLVLLVTRDVYENYESSLLSGNLDSVRAAKINGIDTLYFRGIPVVDIAVDTYMSQCADLPQSVAILTDRRNLAMAVNTSDFPGAEVAMWYNPDELENRQRAIFMAGCDYLMPELMVVSLADVII
ncbi:MAG: hypothetical protein RSC35_04990 [Mucinivorans sp.]